MAMTSLAARSSLLEFGKPLRTSLAEWEASEGVALLTDLLRDPALRPPDPAAFAHALAARAAEVTGADYACVCTIGSLRSIGIVAEHGRRDQRLLAYLDQRAATLTASPAGEDEPSVHTMTGADPRTGRLLSYATSVSFSRNRGRVYVATFREAPSQGELAGFDPLEVQQLRWLTAAVVPLLSQTNRAWSAKNALRAECGAIARTSYAAVAHQLLFANLAKVVKGHLSEIQAALAPVSAAPLEGEREEYVRRMRDAANALERFTGRAYLEAEADAPLPRETPEPLHPGRFLGICVKRFMSRVGHVRVEAVASDEPLDALPVVRVDLGHLEMVVQGLVGLLASLTFCDDVLLADAGIEPTHVWFRFSHAGPLADPEGLTREARMVESLAQAVGGLVTVTTTSTGGADFTLSVPRSDHTPIETVRGEPEEVGV